MDSQVVRTNYLVGSIEFSRVEFGQDNASEKLAVLGCARFVQTAQRDDVRPVGIVNIEDERDLRMVKHAGNDGPVSSHKLESSRDRVVGALEKEGRAKEIDEDSHVRNVGPAHECPELVVRNDSRVHVHGCGV